MHFLTFIEHKLIINSILCSHFKLVIIMVFTGPSDEKFEKWAMKESGIVDCNSEGECIKDNKKIRFSSSHMCDNGIFTSYEMNYVYDNGQMTTLRTLGILGVIF
ncbi:hypothetical protein SM124_16280 [Bacillus sp. 31A1R]|uniref:Uncharacterized protein n=1 Tax=Robertmurraya mangrovi TaxID=3098077 RepID=A0ABU5J1P1_9BACI|nr:hypothetical protein [Bacillus sp. 31A1R]